ncbi:MAG TPA: KH domain-containing protein [Terriglobales bacterium]|nr:KH domain-containing protein [Terriglobales bacterium]
MTEQQSGDVRALVEQIAKALVDAPDQVSVNQVDGEITVFAVKVAPGDVGKILGRQGRVARAMRALINAAGIRAHKRFGLEITE